MESPETCRGRHWRNESVWVTPSCSGSLPAFCLALLNAPIYFIKFSLHISLGRKSSPHPAPTPRPTRIGATCPCPSGTLSAHGQVPVCWNISCKWFHGRRQIPPAPNAAQRTECCLLWLRKPFLLELIHGHLVWFPSPLAETYFISHVFSISVN